MRGRIRTVKPDALMDEDLWDIEEKTGLPIFRAFVGLLCFADREGRFEWRPRALKAVILPYWDGDFVHALNAIEAAGIIVSYEVDGRRYGWIPKFLTHQVINIRETKSTIPEPPSIETHVRARASTVDESVPTGINIPPQLRAYVFLRDGNKCLRCGATSDLSIDHIFPRSAGGNHAVQNLRTLCRSCNSSRPVAGDALVADLAKDGLTLSDQSRMCTHVHAPGEWNGNGNGNGNGIPPNPPKGSGHGGIGNLDQSLQVPIRERAQALMDEPHRAEWVQPHRWPEVIDLSKRVCAALGWSHVEYRQPNKTVRNLVEVLATFTAEQLDAAIEAAPHDRWLTSEAKGLSGFTPTVVAQLVNAKGAAARKAPDPETERKRRASEAAQEAEDEARRVRLREVAKSAQSVDLACLMEGIG